MEVDSSKPSWLLISFGTMDSGDVTTWNLYLSDYKAKQNFIIRIAEQYQKLLRSRLKLSDRITAIA